MAHIDNKSRPFQKEVFKYVSIGFFAILVLINFGVYYIHINVISTSASESLKNIAESVAKNVSYINHEKIINNDQQNSAEYKEIVNYFNDVMDGNPLIFDIYTLRPTTNADIMTFVVAARETQDANGDNYIDESEIRPSVGERYDTSSMADLKEGLVRPSSDSKITADKWGQWLSGYAPILNADGETIAVLGVDEAASEIVVHRREFGLPLLYMDLVLIPLLILLAYYISRILSKPFGILAVGMQRVSHGELDYRLPLTGSKTEVMFEKLFNNMLTMYDSVIKQFKKDKDDDFNS